MTRKAAISREDPLREGTPPLGPIDLARRLVEATATIQALVTGQVDAVFDARSSTPVLLAAAQQALRDSEARYRRIVETANEGIWTVDVDQRITFVNLRLVEMLGYPAEEMIGRSMGELLSGSAQAGAALRLERSRRGISEENEVATLRKDGVEIFLLIKTSPILDPEGTYLGTLAMITDRTHHWRAEEALRKSEEQYREIVEATTDGIIKVYVAGLIVFTNERFAEMLGYAPGEMLGASVWDLMDEAARPAATEAIERARQGVGRAVDSTLRHKDGTAISVNVAGSELLDAEGRVVGHLAVIRDVTESKKLHHQLLVSDRMASVGTLAAGVAHEINNPLASVMANLECIAESITLLAADPAAGEIERMGGATWLHDELKAPVDEARQAARHMRSVVRDLNIFSRSPSEDLQIVDVNAIMESTLRMAWNEIRHRARLVKDYGAVPGVKANEARLAQVFLNLVINAAQALDEGRAQENEIRISTCTESERVVVTVSDTGAGIAPEILGRIFDAFFTTKAVGVGTGLGLAICQRIVTDMAGELTVESHLGRGTTFRVALPASMTANVGRSSSSDHPYMLRRGRILVVDDEPLVARSVKRILRKDHDVTTVVAAKDALDLCAAGARFDLILSDLMMPDMTGMDLHDALMRIAPAQARRMMFLTGGAFTAKALQFLREHAQEHLEKPFDSTELRETVQRYLRRTADDPR